MVDEPLQRSRKRLASVDWLALRRAFVERPERPLMADLSAEFGVSVDRINRSSHDEGWATLRASHLGERLKVADAGVAILAAAKADTAVTRAFTDTAIEVIREVHGVVTRLGSKKIAETTRANTLNTCAFTMSNLANALARVGVVGLPKSLKESAGVDSGNGRWNPQMLAALNVTVQTIVGQGSHVLATTAPAQPIAATVGPSAGSVEVEMPPDAPAPGGERDDYGVL